MGKDRRRRCRATAAHRPLIGTQIKPATTGAGDKDEHRCRSAETERRRLLCTHAKPAAARDCRLAGDHHKATATRAAGKDKRCCRRAATGCCRLIVSF